MSAIVRVTTHAVAGIVAVSVAVCLGTGAVATMRTSAAPVTDPAAQAADAAFVASPVNPNDRRGGLIFTGIGPQQYPQYQTS